MAKTDKDTKAVAWCAAIAGALIVIGWVNTTFFNGGDPTADDRQSAALTACEASVRAQLKSPSSAEFSNQRYTESADVYQFTGTVDADNSFGASLRTGWTCTAEPIGDGDQYTGDATLIE